MLNDANARFIAALALSGLAPLHELSPSEARAAGAGLVELHGRGPEMLRVEDVDCGRLLVPAERCRGVIVYYHGGGWVTGGLDEFDALGRRLAAANRMRGRPRRLSPRSGASLPDGGRGRVERAGLDGGQPRGDRGRPVPLIVAGDSAGGGLAAVVAQRARAPAPRSRCSCSCTR